MKKKTDDTPKKPLRCYFLLLFILSGGLWEFVEDVQLLPPQVLSYVFHNEKKEREDKRNAPTYADEAETFVLLMNEEDTLDQKRLLALLEEVMDQDPAVVGIDISNEHVPAIDPALMAFLWKHQDKIVVPSSFVKRDTTVSGPAAMLPLPETMMGDTRFGEQSGVTAYYERGGADDNQSKYYRSFSALLCDRALGRRCGFWHRGLIDFSRKVGVVQDNVSPAVKKNWFPAFRGGMVIIGSDSADDRMQTPVGMMAGAEIHAYAAATIFRKESGRSLGWVGEVLRRVLAGAVLLLFALLFRRVNASRKNHGWLNKFYGIIVNCASLIYGAMLAGLVRVLPSLVSFNLAFWSILAIPFFVLLIDDFINNYFF